MEFVADMNTINKNMETLIDGSNVVDLEINVMNPTYMLVSHLQNTGQSQDI
jgi:hypothetical protein